MKLVQLPTTDKTIIYVNPEAVQVVLRWSATETWIAMMGKGEKLEIALPIDQVAQLLADTVVGLR